MTLRYTVVLEKGPKGWGAHVPDLPGCVAAGESRAEALALIREAVDAHVAGLREEGLPIPPPVSESDIVEVAGV